MHGFPNAGRAALRPTLAFTAAAAALAVIGPAAAQKAAPKPQPAAQTLPVPKQLGTYDAWTSVEFAQSSGKICYLFARPETSEPKGAKRGDIMMVITHRPAAKSHDEVSFQAGYPFKDGAPVSVDVDGKKFSFFTKPVDPDAAWATDPAADKAIVASMKSGKTLKVRGASARGTETTDTFKLAGFGKAYAEIGKACGVK
jgi:invasion protein IalB